MEETKKKIRNYIADSILFSSGEFPYADNISFLENGVIDSMNVMELVMFVEETFGVSVKDEEIVPDNFDSVNELANFVNSKRIPTGGSIPNG